jgi:hypothetical protein
MEIIMGMQNSDDEEQIRKDHDLMEKIKKLDIGYESTTHNMNEDQKIIYDHYLKEKVKKLFSE